MSQGQTKFLYLCIELPKPENVQYLSLQCLATFGKLQISDQITMVVIKKLLLFQSGSYEQVYFREAVR